MDGYKIHRQPHKGWDIFQKKYQERALLVWFMMRLNNAVQQGARPVNPGHVIKITFIPEPGARWEIWGLVLSRWENIYWQRDFADNVMDIESYCDVQFFNSEEDLEATAMLKNIKRQGFYTWTAYRSDIVDRMEGYRVKARKA